MFSRTLLSLLLVTGIATAQVGIGTTNPSASSALEISSESAGLLIPRINLVSTSVGTPVSFPARGLLVYNTNGSMVGGSGIGFYYWTGSNWNKLLASGTGD